MAEALPLTETLQARLLGEPAFLWEGQPLLPASRKGLAMLALLSLRPGGLHRDELAELLWSAGKLGSVRQALYELRKLSGAEHWLRDGGDTVRLEVLSDVARFEAAVVEDPAEALALYQGGLLDGFHGVNTPAFLDWLAVERDRLAMLQLSALQADAQRLEAEGRFAEARGRVQAALAADPLNEGLYRLAMRLAYVLGDVEGAKELFRRCTRMLRQEFGSEPAAETRELAGSIERGAPLPLSVVLGALPLPQLRLLQALAVGGGALGVEDTAKVVERPAFDVAADLAELEGLGLVDSHGGVAPRHLAQLLASTPMALRRLLHERIADVLVADAEADEAVVGRHLLAAGNLAAAAPRFLRAAKAAVQKADLPGAKALLFRAMWAAQEPGSDRLEAATLLEGVAAQLGEDALQDQTLAEAENLAWATQSDRFLLETRMRRSRLLLRRGQVGEGLERALEGLEIALRLGQPSAVAAAHNAVGGAQFYAGDLGGAETSFQASFEASEEPIHRFRVLNNLGSLAGLRGDMAAANQRFEQALTLARAMGEQVEVAATLNNLAGNAERMSDYPKAVRYLREGATLARRNDAVDREGTILLNLAVVYAKQGELGPGWNTVLEAEELARQQNDPRLLMLVNEQKSEIARLCGMVAQAKDWLTQAALGAAALADERKVAMLRAQLAVMDHATRRRVGEVPGDDGDVEAVITGLEQARLADIASWLWIELALAARRPEEVARWLARLQEERMSRHQRLLRDFARLRAAMLPGATQEQVEPARALADRLAMEGSAPPPGGEERRRVGLASFEVVERPYGWWLLALWRARTGAVYGAQAAADLDGLDPSSQDPVELALAQQAAGLPKAMAASLMAQPQRWLAAMAPA